ncbi:MAG: universal stress protein [Gemmatimonas sp.]
MYKHILIATDGSDLAASAAKHGISLAKSVDAKVTAVTVSEPFHWFDPNMVEGAETAYTEGANRAANALGYRCGRGAGGRRPPARPFTSRMNSPTRGPSIPQKSKRCDLIVMPSHGRRGIATVVLGSQTVKVLTHSAIPVLVCH